MFMNHIENMGLLKFLVFTESGIDYNITKEFGQVKLEKIEIQYQALEISTIPPDNTKNSNTAASKLSFLTQEQIGSRFSFQIKLQ